MLRHKNINYAKFSYSNLQLPVYTAYRSLQKIKNMMVRHLIRPYFLESCYARCYSDAVISPSKRHDLETKSQKSY